MEMSVYRRLARSKKGMSTVFGGLFFIILILMGFNLMIWGFVQYDSYNHVITSMSLRDQQAISENIVPVNPGATDYNNVNNTFNILVNNLGGISVSIARIYILNISPTNSPQCQPSPCIVNPAPSAVSFTAGNIAAGVINYKIHVQGMTINDGSGYKVILSSTRGRLFTFFYPWPQPAPNGGQGLFVTNIGPLSIYFDFKSFNYTQTTQTTSQSAFCMPPTNVIIWVKISNTATDSDVRLLSPTMMEMQPYSANGFGQFVRVWIEDNRTINPSFTIPYVYAPGTWYDLSAASPNGPTSASTAIVKFGGSSQNAGGSAPLTRTDNWLTFIGFYYLYRGQAQGETIPFMDFQTSSSAPNCVS